MSNPIIDIMMANVAALNALGRLRMQHLQPEYLAGENARLAAAWDEAETAKQLAKYGVPLEPNP